MNIKYIVTILRKALKWYESELQVKTKEVSKLNPKGDRFQLRFILNNLLTYIEYSKASLVTTKLNHVATYISQSNCSTSIS